MKGSLILGIVLAMGMLVGCNRQPTSPGELPAPHGHSVPRESAQEGPPPVRTAQAGVHDVGIRNFVYHPASLSIRVGETVRWTNFDPAPHDAIPYTGSWKTPLLKVNESASQIFSAPGIYPYYCSVHPAMRGTVEVK